MTLQALSTHLANGIFLLFVAGIPLFAYCRQVKVYESFIDGAKEGFGVVITVVPYLVAMVVAVGMLRASGAFELLGHFLAPILVKIGMPADVLPMALIRSFSGGATSGMAAEIIHNHGGDSYTARLTATLMGSTETTFYVVAVYFGAVAIRKTRHAIAAGLVADLVSIVAALVICQLLFL